ncbi:hypothetical protein L2E82_38122 [Cichorium intybus]|uniref:Uncharacterized protein n=1 Tax=Cichorium intybus TaxID=13427 RepID=A0ACB9AH76_CICIN|nr:hypothetical protein L2E82_38122 [Cichorium intybus]
MLDDGYDLTSLQTKASCRLGKKPFSLVSEANAIDLYSVMNGPIRQKLKIIPNDVEWDGLSGYMNFSRTPLYCGEDKRTTKGFYKSYQNFTFYWILGAGHLVPIDQPFVSLEMVGNVVKTADV